MDVEYRAAAAEGEFKDRWFGPTDRVNENMTIGEVYYSPMRTNLPYFS